MTKAAIKAGLDPRTYWPEGGRVWWLILSLSLALLVALAFASPAQATDFTVANTNDAGVGTLRQAITDANDSAGADTIKFSISGSGMKTITPASALPTITDPVTIDGTTQSGYAGKPVIEVSGANAGTGTFGLNIHAGSSTVRGLTINNFDYSAISISGSGGNAVEGCYLGTDATGTQDRGNGGGVTINDSASNRIGGYDLGQSNVISGNGYGVSVGGTLGLNAIQGNLIGTNAAGDARLGNDYSGVRLTGGVQGTTIDGNVISGNAYGVEFFGFTGDPVRNNVVSGNYIGTDRTGTKNLGNLAYGVRVSGAIFNDVVGNTVAFNGISGVAVLDPDDKVYIRHNSMHSNGLGDPVYGLGIDLGGDGVTPNDAGDTDTGPNGLQNFPVLTSAENIGGKTVIKGSLESTPNTSFHIEFYSSPKADPSGYGEGRTELLPLMTSVMTDGSGRAFITYTTENAIPIGHVVTATAAPDNQVSGPWTTSEFSGAITVSGPPQTTITSGPSGTVKSTSASFGFSSSEANSTFQCRLDGAAFSPCSSPKSYSNLSNGTHTFRVRAIDSAGNIDPTPAVRTWTVDTTAPSATPLKPEPNSATKDRTPAIKATVKDALTDLSKSRIKLYVDGRRKTSFSYDRDTNRLSYTSSKLSLGKHTVKVVARDAAGNVSVKKWSFNVARR